MSEFTRPRTGTGTYEWAEINFYIQEGCSNGCLYCYAKANALLFGRIKDYAQWQKEKIMWANVNKSWGKRNGVIMFPTTHDITLANLEPSIKALKNMLAPGNYVLIVSKPRLDCIGALCNELMEFRGQILFRFTIGSTNETVCKFWEPGAPAPDERIAALIHAYLKGYQTSVSIEPMLAGVEMAIETYCAVEQFVTDTVWIGKMNRIRTRVDISKPENLRAVEELESLQRDEEILRLIDALSGEAKVRWKDSIKAVLQKDQLGTFGGPVKQS